MDNNLLKTFGICIPTYKRPNLLKVCLESIFCQADPSWISVYVIDDSVSEINKSVIEWSKKSYQNFHFFSNQFNLGIDANIERALNLAGTDYVLVIGEDDILLPGAIEYIKNAINYNNYNYIFANYLYLDNNQSKVIGRSSDKGGDIDSIDFIERYLWASGFIGSNIFSTKALSASSRRYLGTYFNHVGRLVDSIESVDVVHMSHMPLVGNRADDIGSFSWTNSYYDVLFGFERLMDDLSLSCKFTSSLSMAKMKFRHNFGYTSLARVMLMRSYDLSYK